MKALFIYTCFGGHRKAVVEFPPEKFRAYFEAYFSASECTMYIIRTKADKEKLEKEFSVEIGHVKVRPFQVHSKWVRNVYKVEKCPGYYKIFGEKKTVTASEPEFLGKYAWK